MVKPHAASTAATATAAEGNNRSSKNAMLRNTTRVATRCGGCIARTGRDFRDFTLFGNFIEVAVAFMVATVFETLVSSFVSAFLTPIIGMLVGDSFEDLNFMFNKSPFKYGLFLDAMLTFLITMAVIFFIIVHPSRSLLMKLSPSQLKRVCPFCISNIPPNATVCKFCTREVPKVVNNEEELIHDEDFSLDLLG